MKSVYVMQMANKALQPAIGATSCGRFETINGIARDLSGDAFK